jgi:hypothetical protein
MCKHIWLSWYHLHSSLRFGSDLSVYEQRCRCRSTRPITGATDKVYFRRTGPRGRLGLRGFINGTPTPWRGKDLFFVDFFLQHQGLFHGSFAMGFPPTAHSLDATEPVTRPINAFMLFGCFFVLS